MRDDVLDFDTLAEAGMLLCEEVYASEALAEACALDAEYAFAQLEAAIEAGAPRPVVAELADEVDRQRERMYWQRVDAGMWATIHNRTMWRLNAARHERRH